MSDVIERQTAMSRDGISRRLRAIREHMRMERTPFAEWLGVSRTKYANWEADDYGNFPAEEAMIRLCELIPSLTLDYIYRGKFAMLSSDLALHLAAREERNDPTTPGFDFTRASAIVAARL
jgi:DNA-binding transcriptional regulator YiaG